MCPKLTFRLFLAFVIVYGRGLDLKTKVLALSLLTTTISDRAEEYEQRKQEDAFGTRFRV